MSNLKFPALSVAVLAIALWGCQRNPPAPPVTEYQMHGEVVSLDPSAQTAMIKAGKIEGWMEAMTMEYPVKDKQEFAKLKVGENIQAKLLVQGTDYWIASVNEAPAADTNAPANANAPK
jgi:Cu/Ag efflux protein CusF